MLARWDYWATWEYWFECERWTQAEATILTVCGPCSRFMLSCIEECKVNGCVSIVIGNGCFATKCQHIILEGGNIKYLFDLIQRHVEFANNLITPLEYIEWALTRKDISLPQKMKDWHSQQTQHTLAGQEVPSAPLSTGSNKDMARIKATRQACFTVRDGINQKRHGFQVNGIYKINHNHFLTAVQSILGETKAHRGTEKEEWEKVPLKIKHVGRVPEQ